MDKKNDKMKKMSVFLSLVLRHQPDAAGITLDEHGWADVEELIEGFQKTGRSLDLEMLKEIGYPVLLATSRKSVIGNTLDLPADQRVEGTLVTTVMGVEKGAAFVRVHDIKENLRAIRMTQAILRERKGM